MGVELSGGAGHARTKPAAKIVVVGLVGMVASVPTRADDAVVPVGVEGA